MKKYIIMGLIVCLMAGLSQAATVINTNDMQFLGRIVASNSVTIDSGNVYTNIVGGYLTVLGRRISQAGKSVGGAFSVGLGLGGNVNYDNSFNWSDGGTSDTTTNQQFRVKAYNNVLFSSQLYNFGDGSNASDGSRDYLTLSTNGIFTYGYMIADTNGILYSGGNPVLTNAPAGITNGQAGVSLDPLNTTSDTYGGLIVTLGKRVQEGMNTLAYQDGGHSEGIGTRSFQYAGHAEGRNTTAFGVASHAEGYSDSDGYLINARGKGSHAEGHSGIYSFCDDTGCNSYKGKIMANGKGSHAEGYALETNILAYGLGSHAEGVSQVYSDYGHAEGYLTRVIGVNNWTLQQLDGGWEFINFSSGKGGHAEGISTISSNDAAHAEGWLTVASGIASHSAGYNANATNDFSYVWSDGTVYGSHGNGSYNINPSGGFYIGENKTADTNGNLFVTGKIYLGPDTNSPWIMGLGTTNILFGAGTNTAIFPW